MKSRGSFLSRIIVANVVVFIFTIIMVSVISYYYNTQIIDKHTSDTYQQLLSQTDYNIETLYERVFQIGEEFLNDTEIIKGLYSNELSPADSIKVATRINDVVNLNSFINSVYLYNGITGRFIHSILKDIDIRTIDKEALALIDVRKTMNKMTFLPHTQRYTYRSKVYNDDILSLIFTYSGAKNGNAIFINLKLDAIRDLFNKMEGSDYSNFIIVDKHGLNIINGKHPDLFMQDSKDQTFINKVIHSTEKTNNFIANISGEKSLITSIYNDKLEWYLIHTTDYAYLSKDSFNVLKNIIIGAIIILFISIAATIFILNKIYMPFGQVIRMIRFSHPYEPKADHYDDVQYVSEVFKGLISQVTTLEDSAVKDRNKLKEGFLKDLLNNEGRIDQSELENNFSKLGVQLKPTHLRILVIGMEGEGAIVEGEIDARRALVKDAMYELALRIFPAHNDNGLERIEIGNHSLVLLMNDHEGNPIEDQLNGFIYQVEKFMSIQVKVGVGIHVNMAQSLSRSFETAKEALQYKYVRSNESVFYYDEIQARLKKQVTNPMKLEQALMNQLKMNNLEGAQEEVGELFKEIRGCSIKEIFEILRRIGEKLDTEFKDIVDFSPLYVSFQKDSLVDIMTSFVYIEQVNEFYLELVDFIIRELKGNRYRDSNVIVKNACEFIQNNYRKGDLSADAVAASLQISVPYFSKLFNENMKVTFSNYVTNLRLNEAEELLLHTPLRIKEISENIGFLNSTYFITVFKKRHGVSPNQFRQMKKNN
ncbi:helix-turn-helix domain-containing protein [Paenibacillus sp. FA6]|uniref:helix-turn-helix domain-containing protein n=1 Tax=Paenibacillus sp. FA6 TaxID=3413029 RepID=UPI003F654D77